MSAGGRQRLMSALRFLAETFAPLGIFMGAKHLFGLVAAIAVGIALSLLLLAFQIRRDRRMSPFTAFVAASVIGFGALDLYFRTGFFVKLEPALGNAVTGAFFTGSVLWGSPVIIEFAERSLGRKVDEARRYLTVWTLLWGAFFFLRAGVHLWMAYNVSLDRALLIRGLVGPLSFAVMIGTEMATRWLFYGKRAFGKAPAPADSAPTPAPEE